MFSYVFLKVLEEATGPLDFPPAPASAPEERRKRANLGHEVHQSTRQFGLETLKHP